MGDYPLHHRGWRRVNTADHLWNRIGPDQLDAARFQAIAQGSVRIALGRVSQDKDAVLFIHHQPRVRQRVNFFYPFVITIPHHQVTIGFQMGQAQGVCQDHSV